MKRPRFFKIKKVEPEEVTRLFQSAADAKGRIVKDNLIPKKYLSEDRYNFVLHDLCVLEDALTTGAFVAAAVVLKNHGMDEASELIISAYRAGFEEDKEERRNWRPILRLVPDPDEEPR